MLRDLDVVETLNCRTAVFVIVAITNPVNGICACELGGNAC